MEYEYEQVNNQEEDIIYNVYDGVAPSKVDVRDYTVQPVGSYPDSFELDNLPPVKNQSSVCSCAAHSSSSVLEWLNQKEINKYMKLSVGFIYGMQGVEFERMEKGMYLRDVCKILQRYGDCLHDTFPFNIEMPFCYNQLSKELNDDMYKEASICRVASYAKCTTDDAIKHALIEYGPVLVSLKWYNKYKWHSGDVINFDTDSGYGYHAIMVYGFNEKGWLCQNSWGKLWGNGGRFILPYTYKFAEAWSFVDAKNDDIHKPKRNTLFDYIYKCLNYIINLFKKK